MPKTGPSGSPELTIKLDANRLCYNPGDTIIGGVSRNVLTVSTRAWVTVRLYGRAKSKLTVRRSNGNSTTTHHYRGRFNLLAQTETCQQLFDGPVHIPPNSNAKIWPFAITIPTSPCAHAVKSGNAQDRSFLPLNDGVIAASSLPSSFMFEKDGYHKQFHGFVEYYLEAGFRQENSNHLSKATLPLTVLETPSPYPFQNFDLKSRESYHCIKTQRLVPGMENADLTFHQKAQKFFSSSKVPQYAFSVKVDYPTIIQMQNPNPISFKISIVPNREQTSDIIVDVPQTITIATLSMELQATTSIICDGTFSSKTASGTIKHPFGFLVGHRSSPITITPGPDTKELDLGALAGLSLHPRQAYARGQPLQAFSLVYPSFVTYNIKHYHHLKWDLVLKAAGESVKVSGLFPVSILAAS